jgi:hypothetical protein
MSSIIYDAFLPCGVKDITKLPYVVYSLIKYAKNIKDIHICTQEKINPINLNFKDHKIYYHIDSDVLRFVDRKKWMFRPNWTFQQMLKLFQNVTDTEYYLAFDVDGVLNRQVTFQEEEKPIWYIGWEQNHSPYFCFSKKIINVDRLSNHTFIGDMGFFKKEFINKMLLNNSYTIESFIKKSYEIVQYDCHMSEYELYGNFVHSLNPNFYKIKNIKQLHFGVRNDNPNFMWSYKEIEEHISKHRKEDVDIIQMHTWCGSI